MITLAWTAFEVMAGDLWETAINTCPDSLARLQGSRWGKFDTKDSKSSLKDENSSKKIDLDVISENGFDLSCKMGTVLREKFNFSVLGGIREAYAKAFDTRREGIEKAINDDSLDYLAATRNMLVHTGGRADKKFCERVSRHGELSRYMQGERVNLTADLVVRLVNAASKTGSLLITNVDEWLQSGK